MNHTADLNVADLSQNIIETDQSSCIYCYVSYIFIVVIFVALLKKYMAGPYYNTKVHDLTGKYAVVTGGNSGIGKETVLELIRLNCNVIFGARDRANSQTVVKIAQKIISDHNKQSTVTIDQFYLDLASKKSIQQFSDNVHRAFPKIDFLVNNAGVAMMTTQKKTQDGFQFTYGVNHLGHFYLTNLLMDLVKKSDFFRIINVSSRAHKSILGFGIGFTIDWENLHFTTENSYEHNLAYSRSKLCNVLFTKGLAKRIPVSKGVTASLHPGVVDTEIFRNLAFLKIASRLFFPLMWLMAKNSFQGAQTTLFTLLDSSIESGEYYADCSKNSVHSFALESENVEKLWKVSEKDLGIKFDIAF